jgi:hypothetical protein
MLDFDLDATYPTLSSDEGPPFGEGGIFYEGWEPLATTLAEALLRWN